MMKATLSFFTVLLMISTAQAQPLVSCGSEALRVMVGLATADSSIPTNFHSLKNVRQTLADGQEVNVEIFQFSNKDRKVELELVVQKSCQVRSVQIQP